MNEPMITQSEAQAIVKRALLADLMGEAPISTVGSIRKHHELMYERVSQHLQRRFAEEAIKEAAAERADAGAYACDEEGPVGTARFTDADGVGDSASHREEQAAAAMRALKHHREVLEQARALYQERGIERGEVWKRSGVRGQVFHLLAKAERAFQQCEAGQVPNRDHFIDMINYAAFAVRLIDEFPGGEFEDGNFTRLILDGSWPWAS